MADQIGSYSFISVDGQLDKLKPTFEDISRPNTNGRAYRRLGNRGQETEIRAVRDYASATAANTALAVFQSTAFTGTAVNITQYGQARGTFFIIEVTEGERFTMANACGGITPNGTHMLEIIVRVGAVA